MLGIRYTAHALERMQERNVRPEWVEATIRSPEWVETDPGSVETTRFFQTGPAGDERVLRVVARVEKEEWVVITAFFDRGARRRSE